MTPNFSKLSKPRAGLSFCTSTMLKIFNALLVYACVCVCVCVFLFLFSLHLSIHLSLLLSLCLWEASGICPPERHSLDCSNSASPSFNDKRSRYTVAIAIPRVSL